MALVETAGPASVTSNTNTVTSGSYTPTASTLQVAIATVGNGNGAPISAVSLTDTSGTGAWTLLAGGALTENGGYAGVWVKNAWASAATVTFTATVLSSSATGTLLTIRQFAGAKVAASQTGATAVTTDATVITQAITPTQTGSQVLGGFGTSSASKVLTANGSTTIYTQYDGDPNGDTVATFKATSLSTASTPITLGFTNAAAVGSTFALAEILATSSNVTVNLVTATVAIAAPVPTVKFPATVALVPGTVAIAAPPVTPVATTAVTVNLVTATVGVAAQPVNPFTVKTLLCSVAGQSGTDSFGNAFLEGITAYVDAGAYFLAAQLGSIGMDNSASLNYWTSVTNAGPWTTQASIGMLSETTLGLNATDVELEVPTTVVSPGGASWQVNGSVTDSAQRTLGNSASPANLSKAYVIPANDANVSTIYEVEVPLIGVYETQQLNIGINLDGTFTNVVPVSSSFVTAGHGVVGTVKLKITVLTTGSGGTADIDFSGTLEDSSVVRSASTATGLNGHHSALAIDTTAAHAFAVAAEWASTATGQSLTGTSSKYTRIGT